MGSSERDGRQQCGSHVDVLHAIPDRRGQVEQGSGGVDPGGVDQDVDRPGPLDEPFGVLRVGEVTGQFDDLGGQSSGHCGQFRRAQIGQDEAVARGGEPGRDRGADAAAGPGDEHGPHYSSFPFVSGMVR
jgi:hypothetical protein